MNRYHRQILLAQISEEGQRKLASSLVLLVGCGALGTVIVEQLVRAGVGTIRLCDRDVVEETNLQRQTLFTERDALKGVPKAIAAASRLGAINSQVRIEPHVADVYSGSIEPLVGGDGRVNLIIDGTDNVETRYLLNDAAVKFDVPWVYGACVGTTGRAMGIVPGKTPCLRCLFPEPPGPGELQTCDTAGVLAAAAGIAASLEVVEAMKILLGDAEAGKTLVTFNLWPTHFRAISTHGSRRDDCPTCGLRRFEFLDARSSATSLCGRKTVQIRPADDEATIDLAAAAKRLSAVGSIEQSPHLLRFKPNASDISLTLFADGRALVHGTSDLAVARSTYAKFVGH